MPPIQPFSGGCPAAEATAHATIFPGPSQTTVTWFIDSVMDRAENYESVALALARAEQIKGILLQDGWKDTEGS
jgi:hypothetical protein